MARVSIEVRAAAAAKKLARDMGWTRTDTIGRLYDFWHDSQELEQTECTVEDIALWMDCDKDALPDLVDGMIDAGFIENIDTGRYRICGNQKHIENLCARRDAARENGKQGGRPRKEETQEKPTPVISENQSGLILKTQANPADNLLCSALQFSALQGSALGKEDIYIKGDKPKAEDVETCVKQFGKTLEHYKAGTVITQYEREQIWKLLQSGVPVVELAHAISGMRYEPKTDTYDPAKHINVARLWDSEKRNKLYRLSCQEQEKREAKRLKGGAA